MTITREIVNDTLGSLIPCRNSDVLTKEGFAELADWSEMQDWWCEFSSLHKLQPSWRDSPMVDPYMFALALFRFIKSDNKMSINQN